MKIKELIYKTPDISEEKLLEFIELSLPILRNNSIISRMEYLHKDIDLSQAFLDEYDLIQDKKSKLTKSQRNLVTGFVGLCMVKMVKDNGGTSDGGASSESTSEN